MNTKAMSIEAMDEAGKGLARIAILSAIDHDEDTYAPGAFGWPAEGHQWVQILPAHQRNAMPLGKARVYEEGDAAYAELSLNLGTAAGRDWHEALKFDLANGKPVQEWSYGYKVLEADFQVRGDSRVRVLKRLRVDEVSPVLRGAGIGSATLAMKGLKGAEMKAEHFAPLIAALDELTGALPDDLTVLSATGVKQLGDIHTRIAAVLEGIGGQKGDDEADRGEADRIATDTALAGYLMLQARQHLV